VILLKNDKVIACSSSPSSEFINNW